MTEHHGKTAAIGTRWTFADKGIRDVVAANLQRDGWKVKRSSMRNKVLHPMYVDDRKQGLTSEQCGFGNTIYKTAWSALYMVKIIERKVDAMKHRMEELETELRDAEAEHRAKPAYNVGVACDGFTVAKEDYKGHPVLAIYNGGPLPVVRFGVRKAIAIHAAKDEIQKFVEEQE